MSANIFWVPAQKKAVPVPSYAPEQLKDILYNCGCLAYEDSQQVVIDTDDLQTLTAVANTMQDQNQRSCLQQLIEAVQKHEKIIVEWKY